MKKKILLLFLSFITVCICLTATALAADNEPEFLSYPKAALGAFDSAGLKNISSADDYEGNKGRSASSLYISPYWKLTVAGKSAPVYATDVYDYALNSGVVQSFEYIFADKNDFPLDIKAYFDGIITDCTVLPESLGCKAEITAENCAAASLEHFGAYTFLINGESQDTALTVFVKEKTDENKEITAYTAKYGKENVAVYEKGVYSFDEFPTDKKVIYFKRGAYIAANHKKDIADDEDAENAGLKPFFELNSAEGAAVAGCGTFDFGRLDRKERTLINLNFCKNTSLDGLIILNPNSWTVTVYGSESCTLDNITVFGYRTNSDGINICGCSSIKISDCFCRNGDDSFSVKTTNSEFECSGIEFSGCIGWSNKARCFGITGEVERNIKDIIFKDCAVLCRNANWDNDRVASLSVSVETGGADISNVTFENIEIHRDEGRPIFCGIINEDISGCEIKDVVFKNITYSAAEQIKLISHKETGFFASLCSSAVRNIEARELQNRKFFSFIVKLLKKCYDTDNGVTVMFDNVSSGQTVVDKNSQKEFITAEGNVIYKFR